MCFRCLVPKLAQQLSQPDVTLANGCCGPTTTKWDAGVGFCSSELDFKISEIETPELCWETCLEKYPVGSPDELVAIDWSPRKNCYCQNACKCMSDVGDDSITITRNSKVDALPAQCPGEDRRKLKSRKAHK